MKVKLFLLQLTLFVASVASAQGIEERKTVVLETDSGTIKVALYNETPRHRDNFLKLANEGQFDGMLFHRVIYKFMIQSGAEDSKNAKPGQLVGEVSIGEDIPAEIVFPKYFHKRGSLAAAREGDNVNPERKSSGSEFYIVWGQRMNDEMLDKVQERIDEATGGTVKLTPEIREAYYKYGGCPHLDGQYTVFGEVVEGLQVVNKIQLVETDENDRPVGDIRIIRAYVEE